MNKPALPNLQQFAVKSEDGSPILDDEGNLQYELNGAYKTLDDVLRLCVKNASKAQIEAFWTLYQKGLQVAWVINCLTLDDLNTEIEARNADNPLIGTPIDISDPTLGVHNGEPYNEFPEQPPVVAAADMATELADYSEYRDWQKKNAITYANVVCSVSESDQNGWASITVLQMLPVFIQLAKDNNVPFYPINFNNENGETLTISSWDDWAGFVQTGVAARMAFFQ